MKKRIIIILIVLGVIAASVFGISKVYNGNMTIEVYPVANLNYGWYEDPFSSSGMVYETDNLEVYLEEGQLVKEVYVEVGQEVKEGDKLMAFDTTAQGLALSAKQIEISPAQQDLQNAQNEIYELQNMTTKEQKEKEIAQKEAEKEKEKEKEEKKKTEKVGDAWAQLDKTVIDGYTMDENVRVYLIQQNGIVFGSFMNMLIESGAMYVRIETREDNKSDGTLRSVWQFNTADLNPYSEEEGFYIENFTQAEIEIEIPETADGYYTQAEINSMIQEVRSTLPALDLAIRKAQLEYRILKESATDGIVYAKKDGVVKTVYDKDYVPADGQPFLQVSSSGGTYIQGAVSELMLDKVSAGQSVYAKSWETGMTYLGTVESVDTYPVESDYFYYGSGQEVSYYAFKAVLEDADDLSTGDYLELRFEENTENMENKLVINRAFVRKDSGGSYVLKDSEGKLVKQYITKGKTYYGEAVEIKEGLSEEDYIAFPYGKSAKEGVKTYTSEEEEEVYY